MSEPRALPGWSLEAQAAAWFAAWLRALRAGDADLLAQAAAGPLALGVAVSPVPGEVRR